MLCAVITSTFCFSLALAALSLDNGTVPYTTLSLPTPLNWVPRVDAGGDSLIESVYKQYNQYNASGWQRYVLAECESLGGGSCVGWTELTTGAYNTEQPYRIWWVRVYGEGVKLTLDDFRRDISENDQVQDTFAFITRDSGPVPSTSTSSSPGTTASSPGTSTSPTSTAGTTAQTDTTSSMSASASASTSTSVIIASETSTTGTSAAGSTGQSSTAAESTSASPATSTGAGHKFQPVGIVHLALGVLLAAAT